jgi:hypothetical protein
MAAMRTAVIAGNPTTAWTVRAVERTTPSRRPGRQARTLDGVPFHTTTSAICRARACRSGQDAERLRRFDVIQRLRARADVESAGLPRVMAFAASWFSRWIPSGIE